MASSSITPRLAKVFDGLDGETGKPLVTRHELRDGETPRILAYLDAGPVVLFANGLSKDAFFPDARAAVPMTFATDGTWVWAGAVAYYLKYYGMPPEDEFLEHIRGQDYELSQVSERAVEAARVFMTSAQRGGGNEPVPRQ